MTGTGPSRPDTGALATGLGLILIGVAFLAEAAGVWTFRLSQLAVTGPLLLIGAGVAVLARAGTGHRRPGPGRAR